MIPELLASWLAIGVVAGLLVYFVSPRKLLGGIWANLLIGIGGAMAGGYLIADVTRTDVVRGEITWGLLITTVIAALLVSMIIQLEAKGSPAPATATKK